MSKSIKKLSALTLAAALLMSITYAAFAGGLGGTVTHLSAAYNASSGKVSITGKAEDLDKDIVVLEILKPSGTLLYFGTSSVTEEGEFSTSITVGALSAGTYTVRSADYSGGTYTTAQFAVAAPSGGGGGNISPPAASLPVPITEGDTTSVATQIRPTLSGKIADALVPEAEMNGAIDAAVAAAEDNNTSANVKIVVDTPGEATEVRAIMPATSINKLADSAGASLTVATTIGSITFDGSALAALSQTATGTSVTIAIAEVPSENLTAEQLNLVGNRPVVDLSVTSGGNLISDFAGGKAVVTMPYTLAEGESAEGIVVWYLADDGKLTPMECAYDATTKSVSFVTGHFSQFVLGYFPFADVVGDEWFYENVVYAYNNGLMNGTGAYSFDPAVNTNRAMLTTVLWRIEGEPDAGKGKSGTFMDVAEGIWYTEAIEWAAANNIVFGYDTGNFGPMVDLTRQDMAVILYRYAQHKGYEVSVKEGTDVLSYKDGPDVSKYAIPAMEWTCSAGLIKGYDGYLMPVAGAQRAQVAAVLQRFIENAIK